MRQRPFHTPQILTELLNRIVGQNQPITVTRLSLGIGHVLEALGRGNPNDKQLTMRALTRTERPAPTIEAPVKTSVSKAPVFTDCRALSTAAASVGKRLS